jgi:oxygen-independent coproporphyrinogen III oxidase
MNAPMNAAGLGGYDRPVPRYTSYPTAAQFEAGVGPAQHRAWLADLNEASAALYLHVPFCTQLCWYCACHTAAVNRAESLEAYARAVATEIDRVAAIAPEPIVGAIQWGGGTPSQLGASRLVEIAERLALSFDRLSGAEISMEVDPRYCDDEVVGAMKEIGINRASMGVQDFDPAVQRAINRLQSVETTEMAARRLRRAGIAEINVDLVYGLPLQTLDSLSRTLEAAVALEPDRFAVFGYAHVPWMKPRQGLIDAAALPGTSLRVEMAALVARRLSDAGYVQIGLDHYAHPRDPLATAAATGRLRRNFQGYVVSDSPWVVGFGASAISSLPCGFTQNAASAARYIAAIETGELATARGLRLSDADRLRGEIIDRLMCVNAADIGSICRRHGVRPAEFLAGIDALPKLIEDGLVVLDRERLSVTDRGRPLVRSVCAAFDGHLATGGGRHTAPV